MLTKYFYYQHPVYLIGGNMTEEKLDYHADTCTCYGCRQGTTLKEKDRPEIVNCQQCNKHKSECDDWNDYYHACEGCIQ